MRRGLKLASHREKPFLFMGRLHKAIGQHEVAEKMFTRAVQIQPECVEALRELRLINMRREKQKGLIGRLLKRCKPPKAARSELSAQAGARYPPAPHLLRGLRWLRSAESASGSTVASSTGRRPRVHVLTHTLHYGLGVFEGIRCYRTADDRSAVFRLGDHLRRLYDSAHINLMQVPFTREVLEEACLETLRQQRPARRATCARSSSSATARWGSTRAATRSASR